MFGKEKAFFINGTVKKRTVFLFLFIFIIGEILVYTQRGKLNGMYFGLFYVVVR